MRIIGLVLLAAVTLLSFMPVIGLVLAGATADWFGCRLDEGSAHPCIVAGSDIGDGLYAAGVLGWLMFVTGPGMLASLALWTWIVVRRIRRRRRERST